MFQQQMPYVLTFEAQVTYRICKCGQSHTPPFYDGAHCRCQPYEVFAEKQSLQWICGCGRSDSLPFCDGKHNQRNGITPRTLITSLWHELKGKKPSS